MLISRQVDATPMESYCDSDTATTNSICRMRRTPTVIVELAAQEWLAQSERVSLLVTLKELRLR